MNFLFAGAVFGATGVLLGAFGAHALKDRLTDASQSTWETAVQYQLVHALALLVVGVLVRVSPSINWSPSGWLFVLGILLFSGSLYVLALGGPRWLGPITPLGGVCFLAAWGVLAASSVKELQ